MALTKASTTNRPPSTFSSPDKQAVVVGELNRLVDEIEAGSAALASITVTGNATVGGDLTVTGTTTLNGNLVLGDAAADTLTINATTTYTDPVNYSNQTGITAFAGGGQASATALTEEVNNITTVATAGDSVKLPAAVAGKRIHVKNSGATALDIFPASADSIDALAINLAIRIQPGSSVDFYAKDGIVWESTIDQSFTLVAPTTNTGQLELKATPSAGNTVTTITNASQAAARIYTIPDVGTDADFVMTAGAQSIAGVKTFSDATDATTKDTGAIVTEGGIGVEKAIVTGTTVTVGTALSVGTDQSFAKEVNHTVYVTATTTAATAGGNLSIGAGDGATTGAGGALAAKGGDGGDTGTGGNVTLTSGFGGATSGNSGAVAVSSAAETGADLSGNVSISTGTTASANSGNVSLTTGEVSTAGNSGSVLTTTGRSSVLGDSGPIHLTTGDAITGNSGQIQCLTGNSDTSGNTGPINLVTGDATIGGTGDVNITTGNTASGLSGDVILTTGTGTSATVVPVIKMVNGVQRDPGNSPVASGGTITAVELVRGHITGTGATGNWQLPTAAEIITALGSVIVGTNFEFIFNAATMTATNTATLVVGAGMTVASAPAITGGATLTVTQDTQVVGRFWVVFDTLTTCKISRMV